MDALRTYEIDRKTASRILKISTRSIDRYIRTGKLAARRIRGRILLSRDDLMRLKEGAPFSVPVRVVDTEDQKNISYDTNIRRDGAARDDNPWTFYKDLYEEALRALDEKNRKLEQANYRIGQLESQVGSHFPQKYLPISEPDGKAQEKQNIELMEKLRKEKLNRNILAGILYVLILLQPILWYFLRPGVFQ